MAHHSGVTPSEYSDFELSREPLPYDKAGEIYDFFGQPKELDFLSEGSDYHKVMTLVDRVFNLLTSLTPEQRAQMISQLETTIDEIQENVEN